MRKAVTVFAFATVLILSSVTGALAASVVSDTTWSWTCIAICATSNATSTAVVPAPIPPWVTPTTGTWISSSNSGTDGSGILLNTDIRFTSPTLHFGGGSVLTFRVWADDTAIVLIDGVAQNAFNTTLDSACAAGAIGCESGEFGLFSTGLLTGDHTIGVRVLQLLDNTPYGTLVEGDLSAVPEPTTILLLGSALAAAGVVSRRRFRKSES
jgi:hypothetical protein